jgi:hypothetical protein
VRFTDMRNLLLLLISTTAHAQQTGSCLEPRSRLAQANAELGRLETQLSRILREIRDVKQTVAQMNVSLAACEERQGTGASPWEPAARRAGVAGADFARVHYCRGRPSERGCASAFQGPDWPAAPADSAHVRLRHIFDVMLGRE